ncbi:hypothetical protein WI89_27100 [Burkholderia ubonensis]|uniref:PIN domain-containing protein n=1 Tax=Burkholderia ubonensis TaxID=101571 RepID=UPI0007561304|nr:PIN domain-containing protein [Burkholderia ubonensis]KVD80143.1 hypothetical protein WI89_27100 [Burkholderia ubonensis]
MPSGHPTPAQLWNGDVSFFSIDTDLIQSAGYNFTEGTLNQLPKLLPRSMQLQLTDVVAREVIAHLMVPVREAVHQFSGSSDRLKRSAGIDMTDINRQFEELSVGGVAYGVFKKRIEEYVARCRGNVLNIEGGTLAIKIFEYYFEGKPPFAKRKEKKSEFPDAASLLILEEHAIEHETRGIVASRDDGWREFAEASEYLYCVSSIEELAKLFESTSSHAETLKNQILLLVQDDQSALRAQLSDAFSDHVRQSGWTATDAYSGVVPRVEAESSDASMIEYALDQASTTVWNVEGDPTAWVIEVTALVTVEVDIDITYYVYDSIDREELELGSDGTTRSVEIEVQAYLSCYGVQVDSSPEDWDVDIEIAPGDYEVEIGEVEPDFSD